MSRRPPSLSAPLGAVLLALASPIAGQQASWPQFRGPNGNSVVTAPRGHPREWGAGHNVAWSADVPGGGWSSPIVVGDRVFVSTAVADTGIGPKGFGAGVVMPASRGSGTPAPDYEIAFEMRCYRLTDGAPVWASVLGKHVPEFGIHPSNTYATESPATDGERLFVTFGALGAVVALDLDGVELWRVETGVYPTSNDFGWGSSLVTHGGLVFLQSDNESKSFVVALDAGTGEERWRAERSRGSSWGSPTIWHHAESAELVTVGPDTVIAYEPATGGIVWQIDGVGGSFSSSPTSDGEHLYFGNAGPMSRGPLIAVAAGARGTHSVSRGNSPDIVAWIEDRAGPGFPSPVSAGGFVYVIGSMGILACHDATTGERIYRKRLPDSQTVVATPWTDGERLFVLDETGKTFVLAVGSEFEILRVNEIEGLFWATPSFAGESLLLREAGRLICVRRD